MSKVDRQAPSSRLSDVAARNGGASAGGAPSTGASTGGAAGNEARPAAAAAAAAVAGRGEAGEPARDGNGSTILVALLAAIAETLLVAASYREALALHWIVLLHFLIVTALGLWVRSLGRQDRDASHGLLLVLSTLAVGPLGALGAAIATASSSLGREDQHLLDAWYDRISHSTQVEKVSQQCDMVAVGRTMDLAGGPPQSFSNVLQHGSLSAKQNALGLIARRFHPDYLPALQAALKSDLPVIRVQAAAVAAHVRVELRDELHRLIAVAGLEAPRYGGVGGSSKDARSGLLLAASIERCTTSGLLDEKDRLAGVAVLEVLFDQVLRQLDAKGSAGAALAALLADDAAPSVARNSLAADDHTGGAAQLPEGAIGRDDGSSFERQQENAELRRLYEALLLRRGRYGAFRSLRQEELPALRPSLWSIRPWPGGRPPAAARPGSGGPRS